MLVKDSNETHPELRYWLKICVFNLSVVALLGTALRSKILFPLPFIDQGNLLHGHSHFAFAGWITQVLMVLLVARLSVQSNQNKFIAYRRILIANLLTAYGMLFTFPFEGYAFLSISFSFLSLLTAYVFAFRYWQDLNLLPENNISGHWFKASLVFNVLSSLGTFSLAYLMASKASNQRAALASVYFYLHFQYNGWFFFACMGLLNGLLQRSSSQKYLKIIFWIFVISCFPAYFLAALWMHIPWFVYLLVILAAVAEGFAWVWMFMLIARSKYSFAARFPMFSKWLLSLSALALTVKLALQIGSTVPSLSHIAYGFRPIVIAYLHLVLLGVLTMFILGYIFALDYLHVNKKATIGAAVFAIGILLNEIVLMIQGIFDLLYRPMLLANTFLFCIALIMFFGIAILLFSQIVRQTE